MPNVSLSSEILPAVLQVLEAQRAQLDTYIAEVKRMLGVRAQQLRVTAEGPRPKRKMSISARKRIAAAQKKRWAKFHRKKAEATRRAEKPAVATKTPRPKPQLSAAGRKRTDDATRKRWAEWRKKRKGDR